MKKLILSLMLLLCCFFSAAAAEDVNAAAVAITEANFPDANFRTHISNNCDTNKNGVLERDEIEATTSLYLDSKNINSLKGIEFFTSLSTLSCYNNNLTELDLSKNIVLTSLECSNGKLTALDVSKNIALTNLYCSRNQIKTLYVSNNTALQSLYCSDNKLKTLDVSKNTSLNCFECYGNQLTNIDLSNKTYFEIINLNEQKVRLYFTINDDGKIQVDLTDLMPLEKLQNIDNLQWHDDNSNTLQSQYDENSGIVTLDNVPTSFSYKYKTGYLSRTMEAN